MKKVFCLIAAPFIIGALAVAAFPRDVGKIVSATRAFSLDGRWYSAGRPADGDSILREKLRSMGLDLSRISPETMNTIDSIVDTLSEIPAKPTGGSLPVPSWFREEHSLQMESGDGFMDISFGKCSSSGGDVAKTLARAGWKVAGTEDSGRPFRFATIRNGRETSIVLLEENEGRYLSIRQLEK